MPVPGPTLPVTAFTGDLLVIALEQRQDFSPLSDLQERTMVQPRLRSLVLCRGVPLAGRSEPLDNILQQCDRPIF